MREFSRTATNIPVTTEGSRASNEGTIANLGLRGAMVRLPLPKQVPGVSKLLFAIAPQLQPIEVPGRDATPGPRYRLPVIHELGLSHQVHPGGLYNLVAAALSASHYAQTDPNVSRYNLENYIGAVVHCQQVAVGSNRPISSRRQTTCFSWALSLPLLAQRRGASRRKKNSNGRSR